MMDLAQNLHIVGVHALADLQTCYVLTQTWYEHVAASICADEEVLTVAERPSWYSDRLLPAIGKTKTNLLTE